MPGSGPRCVVITGGPGAGKTTLLAELAARGYAVAGDSARAVIAERRARGESARPDAATFAREILRRDIANHARHAASREWVFFERGVVDALGQAREAAALAQHDVEATLAAHPYHRTAFILPPWQTIYTTDAERDHDFSHAVAVHAALQRWYPACGYTLHELPCMPVAARAAELLRVLAETSSSS